MSPYARDMTDKQRRWWFAHLDEEKSSQGSRTETPRLSRHLTEAQRRRIEERKEAALGRMHGWAYVSGKTVAYQPRATFEHHYEQGFKEGVTEAQEWVTGMWGLAEKLGEIAEKVRAVLPRIRDLLKRRRFPISPRVVKPIGGSGGGNVKYPSADELARRLGITRTEYHRAVKKVIMKKCGEEMKEIGYPNSPEIGLDKSGNVWLKNHKTGKQINTGRPLGYFTQGGRK